jgi:hypothetical protein
MLHSKQLVTPSKKMMKVLSKKEKLLKQLEDLGVDTKKPPRKPRADAGLPRGVYKPRNDKGKARGSYINTAAKYKAVYDKMLRGHSLNDGQGSDTVVRDANAIFPPNLTKFYKLVRKKDREYMTRAMKPAHLEQARWRWLMAEYADDPDKWREHISNWYFIQEDEIELWMYTEWAWAYVYRINGDENRLTQTPIVLSYKDYVAGKYNGRPTFDERGNIIWANGK